METEEWRDIEEFEGLYEISSWGRIKKLTYGSNNGLPKDGMMKPHRHTGGYLYSTLRYSNGGTRTCPVHRLVAHAFIGKRPDGMQINHKDGVKTNNRADNLEYVSPSGNVRHAMKLGLWKALRGVANGSAKLTEEQVKDIRQRYASGERQTALALEYQVKQAHISSIIHRKCWKHI